MARILNIISQIIDLSKKAKAQIDNGKVESTKRIFRYILEIEGQELSYIKKESGSKELFEKCLNIYYKTKKALDDLNNGNLFIAKKLLDQIIELEKIQLTDIKFKKGLQEKTLHTIDSFIRKLVDETNKLSFVKKTKFSCSGHFVNGNLTEAPYLAIVYDPRSKNAHNISMFHESIQKIKGITAEKYPIWYRILKSKEKSCNYAFKGQPTESLNKSDIDKLRNYIVDQWKMFEKIINKFKENDSLQLKKQDQLVKRDPKLLDDPNLFFRCPKCKATSRVVSKRKICHYCNHEIY